MIPASFLQIHGVFYLVFESHEMMDTDREDVPIKFVVEILTLVLCQCFEPEVEVFLHEVELLEVSAAREFSKPIIEDGFAQCRGELVLEVAEQLEKVLTIVRVAASCEGEYPDLCMWFHYSCSSNYDRSTDLHDLVHTPRISLSYSSIKLEPPYCVSEEKNTVCKGGILSFGTFFR